MNITYAQMHEDIVLGRLLAGVADGFYIDIGANDPVALSVTKRFYERGWRGVNIEPLPYLHTRLQADRPRDINLAIGLARSAGLRTLYELPNHPVLSTFMADQAAIYCQQGHHVVERQVPMCTLSQICEKHVGAQAIDFVSIDVEGLEWEVLAGGDWSRWRPRVLLIEAVQPSTMIATHEKWESLILGVGYLLAWSDGQNRFYVREEDRDRLQGFRGELRPEDPDAPDMYHASYVEGLRWIADRNLETAHKLEKEMGTLRAQLSLANLDPHSLQLSQRLHDFSVRHPRVSRMAKGLLRAALCWKL